jgi:hypothetical protein
LLEKSLEIAIRFHFQNHYAMQRQGDEPARWRWRWRWKCPWRRRARRSRPRPLGRSASTVARRHGRRYADVAGALAGHRGRDGGGDWGSAASLTAVADVAIAASLAVFIAVTAATTTPV